MSSAGETLSSSQTVMAHVGMSSQTVGGSVGGGGGAGTGAGVQKVGGKTKGGLRVLG